MNGNPEEGLSRAIATVARTLHAESSTRQTLQKMVDLAVATIPHCQHAGVSIIADRQISSPATSSGLPALVDQIQYQTSQGPCLDAIRHHDVYVTDLTHENRWPEFSSRAVAETGVRSMLSFRLFLETDTLGALNLYSSAPAAFGPDSQDVGEVFASHAALALQAAREHEQVQVMTDELQASWRTSARYARQADVAIALQRSMLTDLPDLAPLEVAARYRPATEAAEIGGDWYDAFHLPDRSIQLTVGDLAGHDMNAAAAMAQARSILRALAVDRQEPPGRLLDRFDTVLSRLLPDRTGTCVCAQLRPARQSSDVWDAEIATAGHLPPMLITDGAAGYVDLPSDLLLGTGRPWQRTTVPLSLPAGATLLLYTDGLIERRDRDLNEGLADLLVTGNELAAAPVDELCDELLARLAPTPDDDVCLLAIHAPSHH